MKRIGAIEGNFPEKQAGVKWQYWPHQNSLEMPPLELDRNVQSVLPPPETSGRL
jgi:hypothetical protein